MHDVGSLFSTSRSSALAAQVVHPPRRRIMSSTKPSAAPFGAGAADGAVGAVSLQGGVHALVALAAEAVDPRRRRSVARLGEPLRAQLVAPAEDREAHRPNL